MYLTLQINNRISMTKNRAITSFNLDVHVMEKFREITEAQGIKRSFVVNDLITDWIETNKDLKIWKKEG